jgi:hypothetical protein
MASLRVQVETAARLGMWRSVRDVLNKARVSSDGSLSDEEIAALDRAMHAALEFERAVHLASALGLSIEDVTP